MSEKIVTLNEEVIKGEIRELVRGSVEETLNNLLEAEADRLTQAARYERSEDRQGYRSGHYDRGLTTTSGEVTLHVPPLNGVWEQYAQERPFNMSDFRIFDAESKKHEILYVEVPVSAWLGGIMQLRPCFCQRRL